MNGLRGECALKSEKTLRKILHKLKKAFRVHYILFHVTLEAQKNLLDSLWVLCQRFLILTRGAICVRPYPRELTDREEREIREQFRSKKDLLRQSNSGLTASLSSVQELCRAFDGVLAKVDVSLPCTLLENHQSRQPIHHYIELFSDIYKYFHKIQDELNSLGWFLMVDDIESILEYKDLLERDIKVEYYEHCLHIGNKLETC